MLEEIHFTAFN